MKKKSILIVNDRPLFAAGLRALIASQDDFTVSAECLTCLDRTLKDSLQSNPDLVIITFASLEALKRVIELLPSARVLMLESQGDARSARELREAGAFYVLTSNTNTEEFLIAVRLATQIKGTPNNDLAEALSEIDKASKVTSTKNHQNAGLPGENRKKTTVLLVDDHAVVRHGVGLLINGQSDMEVVGEAENGRLAVSLARELNPDIVVMDIAMPLMNGLEATRQILKSRPSIRILVLTSYSDDDCVQQLTEAGISGYLIKQTAAKDLVKAIREVKKGNAFFSPTIAKRLRDQCREALATGQPVKKSIELSSREAEVLQLIAEGFSNKQISAELCVSIATIEKHRQSIMNKLNIHDVAGLTRYAISKGLVDPGIPSGVVN